MPKETPLTASTPSPVGSGKPYLVRQVRGDLPRTLTDFAGQTWFVLDMEGEGYTVRGAGVEADGVVRVFEKDEHGYGKDVRVWTVRQSRSGGASFTAEHAAP
jgi:hypothetical protein